tara:strand:- start:448 stop:666 length:219 start_codon:yes stop_codon:yes gene_type:complete
MSAEETVFSIPDLRLYILQFAIEDREMERNNSCLTKCKEKIDERMEPFLYSISCCIIGCFCLRPPNVGILFR